MGASRHLGRVIVLQTLFSYEMHGGEPDRLLEYVAQEFEGKISDLTFASELLHGVLSRLPEIRSLLTFHAPQWPIEKIAPIDRVILEIGAFEMLHASDVPAVVALDESIELAKSFGNENSPKFVNGVLNAILNSRATPSKTSGARKKDSRKI